MLVSIYVIDPIHSRPELCLWFHERLAMIDVMINENVLLNDEFI